MQRLPGIVLYYFFHNMHRGYTLIELFIVIGAIAVLSLVVITRFAGNDQRAQLESASALVRHDIRAMLANAQSGKILTNGDVPAGYGILFHLGDATRYTLYANPRGSTTRQYQTEESIILADRDLAAEENISDVRIKECSPVPCDFFIPTDARILLVNGTDVDEELRVTLEHQRTQDSTIVVISRVSGQVSAQ